MADFWRLLIYLFCGLGGLALQEFLRITPGWLLAMTFFIIILVPPLWSMGLLAGFWVACAFLTYQPEENRLREQVPLTVVPVFFRSLWCFAGFGLTLILVWRLKTEGYFSPFHRELLGWSFFVLMETVIFRIIARDTPFLQRVSLGYGMSFFNYLMVFYWVYPLGLFRGILVFISILLATPLLLLWVDHPVKTSAGILTERGPQ